MSDDPTDPAGDPFYPPAVPTLVGCLHCGEEYESFLIEWRVDTNADGERQGFWCCPTPGCSGKGFGFDILPVDPEYQDERGGWVTFDEDDDDDLEEADDELEVQDDDSDESEADEETPF